MTAQQEKAVLKALVEIAGGELAQGREGLYMDLSVGHVARVASKFLEPGGITARGVGGLLQAMSLKFERAVQGPLRAKYVVVWDQKRIVELCRHRGLPVPGVVGAMLEKNKSNAEFRMPNVDLKGDDKSKGVAEVERVKTGEWGFCTRCGDPVELVVTAADRLQRRLVKAAMLQAKQRGEPARSPLEWARHNLQELYVNASTMVALANYGLASVDPRESGRAAALELRRRMREATAELVVAESALASWLGEAPADVLRAATEEMEKETDFVKGKDKGN